MTIPLRIAEYIRSIWMSEMIISYLSIDEQGNLVDWGGYPRHYGLTNLVVGQPVMEQVVFLEGMLPVFRTQVLQFVSLEGGRSAHVHIVPFEEGTWVLLFDATVQHDQQQKMQQQVNDLSLLTYRQSQLVQELESARRRLAEEKQQLEQASELKSRFIATLSHELRTPLTSIVGYTKLLDDAQQADAREAKYLSSVKNNANHLLALIDNILDQTKLEMGQVVLQPVSCEIRQLMSGIKALFFPTAQEKGLAFETSLQATLPARVMLDELHFRQVLINLITNAFKFTKQGFVQVAVAWQAERLEFAVADSGPGISTEAQSKIFTAFHRERTALALPGVGLGLAISHHLVELMGGELKVDSSPGQGAVFSGFIQAPLAQAIPLNREVSPHTAAKILIADDNIVINDLMEIYLQEGGYTVVRAVNGEEAINLALETQPDLILMDLQMPVIDGYTATQKLRAQHFSQPIIALSASTVASDRSAALQAGCNDYLTKPVYIETLLTAIATALNHSQAS
jgi:signal transduction histidine kinase/CheY-like chemotaxis protein